MDEKTARKVGEVKAFTLLGIEFFEKGKLALDKAFGVDTVAEIQKKLLAQSKRIDEVMQTTSFENVMSEKAEKTKTKVGGMADTYIGDAWDDSTELCEWLGFFEGAALVHWSLVEGKAQRASLGDLSSLAKEGIALHQDLLQQVVNTIKTL